MEKRNSGLDLLRTIGIGLVILAHTSLDHASWLFQLRNFDVVMLVFVSAASFSLGAPVGYWAYFVKRMKRLLLPCWIFLTFFFLFFALLGAGMGRSFFAPTEYLASFCLLDSPPGIGYVWVIRAFLLIALILPLLAWISRKCTSDYRYLVLFVVGCVLYTGTLTVLDRSGICGHALWRSLFFEFAAYAVGYGCVAMVGIRYLHFPARLRWLLIAGCIGVWILFAYKNQFATVQYAKYPPRLYFLTYGLSVTLLLFELLRIPDVSAFFARGKFGIEWISRHSLSIYFAHIVLVYLIKFYGEGLIGHFAAQYLVIAGGSIGGCVLFRFLVNRFRPRQGRVTLS